MKKLIEKALPYLFLICVALTIGALAETIREPLAILGGVLLEN